MFKISKGLGNLAEQTLRFYRQIGVEEVAVPEPGRGEVLVRMLASPVNPSDLMTIRGTYGKRPSLPFTPGYEGVGVVEQSGGGLLANLRRNRRVVVLNSLTGNWAQRAVVPAQQVVPVPADLPVEQAATFFINPVTAWVMLKKVLAIPAGGWLPADCRRQPTGTDGDPARTGAGDPHDQRCPP